MFGVDAQNYYVGHKGQAVERIHVAVSYQPGMRLELTLLRQALLQGAQRG
jgi:hypothetical protein